MKTLLALTLLAVTTNAAAQHQHHDMSTMPSTTTPVPALTDADREAAKGPKHDHPVHDNTVHSLVLFNRLEASDDDGLAWEGQAWIGTDTDKLWLRSDGERVDGRTHASDLEVLYGKPISPWWDVLAGVRHDFKPGASQDWAAIGIVGTAPYKIHVEATAYLGPSGRTSARIEAEYDVLLTNRLILQPLVELNAYGEDDPARGIDAGAPTLEAGLRLRYELHRQFAPYVGVVHEEAFGGEGGSDTRVVAGVRVWF
jgi:copper resistance protein B